MKYSMQLHQGPFDGIKSGRKTIEMRLNDERRRNASCFPYFAEGPGSRCFFLSGCGQSADDHYVPFRKGCGRHYQQPDGR